MDTTKGEPGSEGLTPRPDIDEFKDRVAAGETDEDPGATRIEPSTEKETPPRVIKQNYWNNPEKIKANFSSFEEAMSDEDAKRYGAFQNRKPDQDGETPSFSITEDSDIFKRYQKSLAEKQEETAPAQVESENKDTADDPGITIIEPVVEEETPQEQIVPEKTTEEFEREIQELRDLIAAGNHSIEEGNRRMADMETLVLALSKQVENLTAIVESGIPTPTGPSIEAQAEAQADAQADAPADAQAEAQADAQADAPGRTIIEPPPQAAPQVAVNAEILKTPEQRLVEIDQRIAALEQIVLNGGSLNLAQGQEYAALSMQRKIESQKISSHEMESQARRDNREKWIKRAGFIAGVGVALATPAVGCAAIIAVTLGGNLIGKGLKILEGRTRAKSTAMKYESREGKSKDQVEAMDKKQKRGEWWANRLGEASALLIGGASGYGFGSIIQNVFGVGFGAGAPTPPTAEVPPTGEITPPTGEIVPPNTGGGELPPTGEIIPPVEGAGESVLVQDGRIHLPGSAWDGNLASGPAQDTLLGGANNPSNYNGGLHEMAPFRLEEALVQNGITRAELTSQLDTAQIHQLLNRSLEATRSGTPIDLAKILDSVKPGVSEVLLGGN